MPQLEEFVTNRQLSVRLGVTPQRVSQLLSSGELKPARVGLSTRAYRSSDLDVIRKRQEAAADSKRVSLGAGTSEGVNDARAQAIKELIASNAKLQAMVADLTARFQAVADTISQMKGTAS